MNRAIAILLGLGFASPAIGAPPPINLQPSGSWKVEYGDSACLLNRSYSADGKAYRLELTFEPVQSDVWLRIYDPEQSRSRDDGDAIVEVDGAQIGDKVHFNVIPKAGGTTREFWLREFNKVRPMKSSLRLLPRRHSELRLTTTDFPKAMQAIIGCVDDLHRSLGIDPASIKAIVTKPDGGPSLAQVDFPKTPSGFDITLLYWITTEGKVEKCRVLKPSGISNFDKSVCPQLERKARFKPARDAAGKAVPAPIYEDIRLRRQVIRG
jgi:TonB family protein